MCVKEREVGRVRGRNIMRMCVRENDSVSVYVQVASLCVSVVCVRERLRVNVRVCERERDYENVCARE